LLVGIPNKTKKNAVRGEPGLAFFIVVAIGQILPREGKGKRMLILSNLFFAINRK